MRLRKVNSAIMLFAISAVLAAEPPRSQLAEYTVAELLEPCMEGDNDSRWGAAAEAECEQYVIGFVDAYVLMGAAKRDTVCLPAVGNRADEIRWAFMKWAHQHFEKREMPAAQGLLEAIKHTFPCD